METPLYFQDVMIKGPFRSMRHDHYFRGLLSGSTEMKDVFCFAAPVPLLDFLAETLILRRHMAKLLQERNMVLKEIAESPDWQKYLT